MLLLVQLSALKDESEDDAFLRLALQQGIIESYEYVTCYPVSAFLNPALDMHEQMRCFPLRDGESWLPALDSPNKVYICLDRPFMASNQIAWLVKHQIPWKFEDIRAELTPAYANGEERRTNMHECS